MRIVLAGILILALSTFLVMPAAASEDVHVCTDLQRDCGLYLVCVEASGTVNVGRCVWDPCNNPNVC